MNSLNNIKLDIDNIITNAESAIAEIIASNFHAGELQKLILVYEKLNQLRKEI